MSKRRNRKINGAVMVEFAIILPILVLLVFGIVELGRALYSWNTLTKAIASGARYMARSNGGLVSDDGSCGEGTTWNTFEPRAKNIIIYGNTNGNVSGNGPLLPHLDEDELADGTPVLTISVDQGGGGLTDICVIKVAAKVKFDFLLGPLIPFEFVDSTTLTAQTEERYIGE